MLSEKISENLPVLNWDVWNLDEVNSHTIWLSAEWISAEESYDKLTFSTLRELLYAFKRWFGV